MNEMLKASKKQNNRKSGAAQANKERKRKEALARQEVYDKLSFEDKVKRAVPGSREHQRLLKVI